jgi:hypothetical protein
MDRRTVLLGTATATAGFLAQGAGAAASPQGDLASALAHFRASIPRNFDPTYVENVIIPFFLTSIYQGERPSLPMIDVTLTKENALSPSLTVS